MTLTDTQPSPIAQLRHAARNPVALALGMVLGAFVPCSTYVVVHVGGLLSVESGRVTAAPFTHPGWALVLGGLLFSAKTVYRWTVMAFADRPKAVGFVLLVEGVLMLSPSPVLSYVALALLVMINALGTGAQLALLERRELSPVQEAAPVPVVRETRQAAVVPVVPVVPVAPKPAARPVPPPLPAKQPGDYQVVRVAPPPVLPAPTDDVLAELYTRAIEVARQESHMSAEALRTVLRCRQSTASALLSQLERDGVVGPVDRSNRGRRPVLLSAQS